MYYFPVEQRVELFRNLRSRLSSKGSMVIVMNMEGKKNDAAAANLNLVNASLEGVTSLPNPLVLKDQLHKSGFLSVTITHLMPGSSFVGLHAK